MVEHVVLFKFNETTTTEQMQEACEKFKALEGRIPGLLETHAGLNFSKSGKGYQVLLTARFTDRNALEQYVPHPAHIEYGEFVKGIGLEDIMAMHIEI